MIEVYNFSEKEILSFILVLARISVFLVVWPVFSHTSVPAQAKVLLSLLVSFLIFPFIGWTALDIKSLNDYFIFLLAKEVFIGLAMGFMSRFFFWAIEICGHFISDAIGLSSAQILNPAAQDRTGIIENYYGVLVTLFFLAINGHHLFVEALVSSFNIVPLSLEALNLVGFSELSRIVQHVCVIGLKLSAPIVVSIFCMNVAMGIIGRAVPQMNVLITSLSVNVLVGFLVMIFSLPLFIDSLPRILNESLIELFGVLKSF